MLTRLTTVIPVFNGEPYLETTLQSVANQTRRPDKVIIQDNCSTDGTRQIVEKFRHLGFEWRQNEANLGHTRNLNRALEQASQTEFLHILLADDLIKPQFYERLLPTVEGVSGRAIAYCPFEVIDEHGQLKWSPRVANGGPRAVSLPEFFQGQATLQTILIPAVVLKTAGLPSPTTLPLDMPQLGDCVFYAEWGKQCERIIEVPEILCQYRRHAASGTNRHMLQLQTWVLDEWRVMQRVAALMGGTSWHHWLREQKFRCLFAARSQVKVQMMRESHPDYAQEIRKVVRATVGPCHWALGKSAVIIRDRLDWLRGRHIEATER